MGLNAALDLMWGFPPGAQGGAGGCQPLVELSGSVSAGTAFVHPADCAIAWTHTRPTFAYLEVRFRVLDSSNYWMIQTFSDGVTRLYELVAKSLTQRGTSFVPASGLRIGVLCIGTTIKVYSGTVGEEMTERISYSSAENFATETDGGVPIVGTNGAVSDLVVYTPDCCDLAGFPPLDGPAYQGPEWYVAP